MTSTYRRKLRHTQAKSGIASQGCFISELSPPSALKLQRSRSRRVRLRDGGGGGGGGGREIEQKCHINTLIKMARSFQICTLQPDAQGAFSFA